MTSFFALQEDAPDFGFLGDNPPQLDRIGQALVGSVLCVESVLRKAEIIAHSLKPSAFTFDALGLSALCQRMERCAYRCADNRQEEYLSESREAA